MNWALTASVIFWYNTAALGAGWFLVLRYAIVQGVFRGMRPPSRQTVCWVLLGIWLFMLVRGFYLEPPQETNFSLFYCWREAWNRWDLLLLKKIFRKVLLFLPLGVLLPLASERFQKLRPALLAFAGGVLAAEGWQLISGQGGPDVDDLLHGLAGSLAGYFLIMLCLDLIRRRRLRLKPLLAALAVPAVFAAGIGTAFAVYALQPYGNLPAASSVRQDMSKVSVELAAALPEMPDRVPVYQYTLAGDQEQGRAVLSWVSELTGTQFKAPPDGKSSFSVSDSSGEAHFWYSSTMGSWHYWKISRPGERLSASELSAKRGELEDWLSGHGLLPDHAVLSVPGGSLFQWDAEDAPVGEDGIRYSGYCRAEFSADGSIRRLACSIRPTRAVSEEAILSPEEAFEQIKAGNFRQYLAFSSGDRLQAEGCSLVYRTDSKGFDRPCYLFSCSCLQEDGSTQYKDILVVA